MYSFVAASIGDPCSPSDASALSGAEHDTPKARLMARRSAQLLRGEDIVAAAGRGKLGAVRHFIRTKPGDVGKKDGIGRGLRGEEVGLC